MDDKLAPQNPSKATIVQPPSSLEERGRPTVINEQIIVKLETAFQKGVSDKAACQYAKIGRTTFYKFMKEDPGFANRILDAKGALALLAAQAVTDTLLNEKHRDRAKVAMWVLERKSPEEFGQKQMKTEVTNQAGHKISVVWGNGEPLDAF